MVNGVTGETITYSYDSLNRLLTASGSGWGEQYGFDGFGNLLSKTVTSGSGPSLSVTVNPANNQIQGVSGYTYDANGNMSLSTGTLAYDAENRISYAFGGGASGVYYVYDYQNRRVWSWPGTEDSLGNATGYTLNMYSPTGQKLGAYTFAPGVNGSYVPYMVVTLVSSDQYFGSRRLAVLDQLGSAGTYYPWGENRGSTNPQDTWSFGTYWEDSATGLDYANNRYYSNAYGRFMTPDPYQSNTGGPGDSSDPGSWNRYAYTRGDPVNRFDPAGTDDSDAGDSSDDCGAGWETDASLSGPCEVPNPYGGYINIASVIQNAINQAYAYAGQIADTELSDTEALGFVNGFGTASNGNTTITLSANAFSSFLAGGAISLGTGGAATIDGIAITIGEVSLGTVAITVGGVAALGGAAWIIYQFASQTNEVLDAAKAEVKYNSPKDLPELCDYLQDQLDNATGTAQKLTIIAAMKFAGCRQPRKPRGGPVRRP